MTTPNRYILFLTFFLLGLGMGIAGTLTFLRKEKDVPAYSVSSIAHSVELQDRKNREIDQMTEGKDRALVDVHRIGMALIAYSQDYDGAFPPHKADVERLLTDEKVNRVTASHEDFAPIPGTALDPGEKAFDYIMVAPWLVGGNTAAEQPLASKRAPGGIATVYVDGHTVWKPYRTR